MSGLWCHRGVSPAPGKGQQGHGGQDILEESQTSARKLWSQPGGSCALLSWVCFSVLRNHQWQVPGGPQGQRTKEGVGRRCHPVPEGLGAHLSCLGLPPHGIATARHETVPALLQGQPDTISRRGKARAGGTGGSVMLSLGWGGEVRRALDCNHTGEGGVSPRQEGGQQGFFMTPAAWATPARGRTADQQQVFRARGTESTGVTQM